MPFSPGVSGSASSTVTSPPTNDVDGLVSNVASATVPGSDCSMNAYQATAGIGMLPEPVSASWPGGTGVGSEIERGVERKSHDDCGCAIVSIGCVTSAEPPLVMRRPP